MSESYKDRVIITDDATAMWSFDGDSFDNASFLPLLGSILDDVDNANPAVILHESPSIPNFKIGYPSLIELEPSIQYSAIIGAGTAQSIVGFWPKSYATAAHSSSFGFADRGSFSVEFTFKKATEQVWATSWGASYWTKWSPIIRKAGVFDFSTVWGTNLGGGPYLSFKGPLGEFICYKSTVNFESVNTHIVGTWRVEQIDTFEFRGTQTLYANNRLIAQSSAIYFDDTYPTTNVTTPVEIGGYSTVPSGNGSQGDRNASRLYLDQVAIFSKALTANQVSTHYKKIFTYRRMVINESPEMFWDMADPEVSGNTAILADIGGRDGVLMGGYVRGATGPTQLPPTGAVEFSPTGSLKFPSTGYYGDAVPLKNISGNYTFEFWFRSGCNDICTLLSMQGHSANYDGWLIELNVIGSTHQSGAIQFTERRGVYCNAAGSLNDNQWHHLAVRRSGLTIELFIDGIVVGTTTSGVSTLVAPGQLHVFGYGPRAYSGPGAMCYFAIYNYALQNSQIECRSTYNVGYEIKGIVTLMGNPVAATLRFYYSNTGILIGSIDSDNITGEYRIELYNNASIDIMVFDKYNKNVRYRAYGPVSPAGYEDLPISP